MKHQKNQYALEIAQEYSMKFQAAFYDAWQANDTHGYTDALLESRRLEPLVLLWRNMAVILADGDTEWNG
jgi:hypothetical protein